MPIELCAELAPKVRRFSELEDPQVKVSAYLTIEVLFASRRFQGSPGLIQTSINMLRGLLDNSEIIQNMTMEEPEVDDEGNEVRQRIKVDKKDEMRVIAYIQAVS